MEHVHAAVSSWFDLLPGEHDAKTKPFAVSPLRHADDTVDRLGFEVGVLSPEAGERLADATGPGSTIRLGARTVPLGERSCIARESWTELAVPSGRRTWTLEFLTPVTFRKGDRSTPLPVPASLLRGLQDSWNAFSGQPPRTLSRAQVDDIWVSEISGRSETLRVSGVTLSGFVGQVQLRCGDPAVAEAVDPLLRTATYCGIGSAKAKGLGVVRLIRAAAPARPARRG